MNEKELQARAVKEVEAALPEDLKEPHVVHCEADTQWSEMSLIQVARHRLNVLVRGGDIVVFFDASGKEIGWRDDGRRGTVLPRWIDRDSFRTFVVRELGLPETTKLGRLAPRELPPFGWTHEGVLFLSRTPGPDEVLRVWVDPENNYVIQCLFGPVNERDGGGEP